MTIDHRLRFRQSEYAKQWNNVSASLMFIEASSAAMLEFAASNPSGEALKAAQTYLNILLCLTDPEPQPSKPRTMNLDHRV